MLHFLPDFVLGSLALLLMILNTIFWCVPLYAITLLKLIPIPLWRRGCTQALIWIAENWIGTNKAIFRLTQRADWEVQGAENLKYDGWYLVNSNHQSWADIFVLQSVFNRRIPFLKFFLKQELIWMPVIGLAWWALDFPFMKRYSKAYLEKYPEKRGKDLETTRKACEKFQFTPVSVMNFLEGTRFTPAKHARQESPFRHLLRPRAGGIAFVLGAMGERIQSMLDVTIVYPEMIPTFWDFLSGRVSKVIVRVEELKIPTEFFHGDYLNDPQFRQRFQQWVNQLWQQKDGVIDQMKR
ncbi:MAG: acyltransferase [Anaerolineae bacterium]